MKIKAKLISVFLFVSLLFVIIGLLSWRSLEKVEGHFDIIVGETAPALLALGHIRAAAWRYQLEAVSYSLLGGGSGAEEEEEAEVRQAEENMEKWEKEFEKVAEDDEERQFVEEIDKTEEAMFEASHEMIRLTKSRANREVILKAKEVLEETEETFLAVIDKVMDAEKKELKEQDELADSVAESAKRIILLASAIVLLLAVGLGYLLSRGIGRPVIHLASVAKKLGEGDLSQRTAVTSKDEIGELASSFNTGKFQDSCRMMLTSHSS